MNGKKLFYNKNNFFLKAFIFLTPFLFGGYHIWISAVFSCALSVYLIFGVLKKHKGDFLKAGVSLISLALLPVFYLISSLWAVDSGTAVYGFVKFLPVALFAFTISSLKREEKEEIADVVPLSCAVMGILSYGLSFIGSLSDYFLVAERLGGFFQYPNSFALYCLAGLVILFIREKISVYHWVLAAVLTAIILLTGSRTVFVFLVVVCVVLMIKISGKNRFKFIAFLFCAAAVSFLVILITGNMQTVGRFLTISLESSTLLGRFLYYKDALDVILKNPFGLGYYGYYFSQGAFQNGVYSVAFVHNDFLQLMLDIGWIPSLFFFFCVGMSFFSKKTSFREKLLLFVIFGHSFFDFDLQFLSVFLLAVLCMDYESFAFMKIKNEKILYFSYSAVAIIFSIYFGTVNALFLTGKYETVDKIYGKDTQSQIFLMSEAENYDEISDYADSILSRNSYISIAYSAKANYAYSKGDIEQFIHYKEKAISCAKYRIEEYNDYCVKLINIIGAYMKAGDMQSAYYCKEKLFAVQEMTEEVKESTDELAWKIKDKPELELNEEIAGYIEELKR